MTVFPTEKWHEAKPCREVAPSPLPDPAGDKFRNIPDEHLLVYFRDMCHESPTRGNRLGWASTYGDIVSGSEGRYRVRLTQDHGGCDCDYPGVLVQPDGTVPPPLTALDERRKAVYRYRLLPPILQ